MWFRGAWQNDSGILMYSSISSYWLVVSLTATPFHFIGFDTPSYGWSLCGCYLVGFVFMIYDHCMCWLLVILVKDGSFVLEGKVAEQSQSFHVELNDVHAPS